MSKESVYLTLRSIDGKHGAKQLKRELDQYPGVISVSVNPEKDSLAVDYDNTGVKSEQITNRVTKLGYQITQQKNENHFM